ncbi:MAG: inositol polyphosphate 5-phosphatase [Phylliscum demangeonii]|nr:MAG: inositol polyphosphate 5-phosphatase [Phylliscum demangeonii]
MAIRLLLRSHPHRAIALNTPSHTLVIRHSAGSSPEPLPSLSPPGQGHAAARCIVDFSTSDTVDLTDYRPLTPLPVQGTLGLITLDDEVFLCIVTSSTLVATVRPGETVQRINAVDFYCLNKADYDNGTQLAATEALWQDDLDDRRERDQLPEHPCQALQKLLSGGSFYYSADFDLTNRLQDRSAFKVTSDYDSLDEEFLWNSYMIKPLVDFRTRLATHERQALDACRILTSAIRGFAMSIVVPAHSSPVRQRAGLPSNLTLISRLSCRRAGTRFNARGIDDDGNVANFVESETLFWSPAGLCFSYTQVRGSVPIFWEQATGLLPGQQKIQITRSVEATQPAFDKHVEELERNYGAVHILNLLSESKPGEMELTARYRYHVRHSPLTASGPKDLLRETEFDFHAQTKGPSGYEAANIIKWMIRGSTQAFAYYLLETREGNSPVASRMARARPSVVVQQDGVFRTNCLDCLDRTNLIQTMISHAAIEQFFEQRQAKAASDFWMRHSTLWADNGDCLSKIYAGTGALKSSFTRHGKMSLAGALADARKSATRMYINNFADKGRQNLMDLLLGRLVGQLPVHLYDPINDFVNVELNKRAAEYSAPRPATILVGTFNLNGRMEGLHEDLSCWLCPTGRHGPEPDLVAVGFQEIVELSPQHIMSADPTVRQLWEVAVKKTLDEQAKRRGTEEYVLLRSGQLVGAALMVFVKSSALAHIKQVEGSVKKVGPRARSTKHAVTANVLTRFQTGLSGTAGNKGAVAIRMTYADTRICFVTAHLAAGFANYDERNRDYNTISHGLRFQRNYSIDDHDAIIWLGDFNYRIGLGDEKVRKLVQVGDLDHLYENDQLNLQMLAGLAFPFYSEARIMFPPTYRYDLGVDVYDSSYAHAVASMEKHRIPAWCDRVLYKGAGLRQMAYDAAPLRFSDHRPVYALFSIGVLVIDDGLKDRLSQELYRQRRLDVGQATGQLFDEADDDDLIGYEPIAPGLPPASSDRRKWWLENGLPVRSAVAGAAAADANADANANASAATVWLYPGRLSNPFAVSDEPDWAPRSSSVEQ